MSTPAEWEQTILRTLILYDDNETTDALDLLVGALVRVTAERDEADRARDALVAEREDIRMEAAAEAIEAAFPGCDPDGYDTDDLLRLAKGLGNEARSQIGALQEALREDRRVFTNIGANPHFRFGDWSKVEVARIDAALRGSEKANLGSGDE